MSDNLDEEGEFFDPADESSPFRLRSYKPEEIRRWLAAMCQLAAMKPTQLARAAGIVPSTINRFLNSPVKHRLSATTISKIQIAAWKEYQARVRVAYGQRHLGNDKISLDVRHPSDRNWRHIPVDKRPILIEVKGHVQAGEWREALEWPPEDWFLLSEPPFPEFMDYAQIGLEVRGSSMNLIYPPGTIVICVSFIHVDRNPLPGEKVLVQQRRADGAIEATIKEFQVDEHGMPWLWPRSSDPEYQTPIRFNETGEDDSVLITALVTACIRREHLDPFRGR